MVLTKLKRPISTLTAGVLIAGALGLGDRPRPGSGRPKRPRPIPEIRKGGSVS